MNQFEENVKLENFKAQYQVILGNIRVANSELEKALESKALAETELSSLDKSIIKLNKELTELAALRNDVILDTDGRRARVEEAEANLASHKMETEEYVASELKRLETERKTLDSDIAEKRKQLNALMEQHVVFEDSVQKLSSKVSKLSGQIENLEKAVKKLDEEHNKLSNDLDEATATFNKRKIEMEAELAEIRAKSKEESDKIVIYENHVAKDKATMARRESDLEILKRRLHALIQENQHDRH